MWEALQGTGSTTWHVVTICLASGILIWLVLIYLIRDKVFNINLHTSRRRRIEEIGILCLACLTGFITGMLTGLSRESSVGDIVPAILTLLTAMVGYLYTKEGNKDKDIFEVGSKHSVPVFVFAVGAACLAAFFLWGSLYGAYFRALNEEAEENYKAEKEARIAEYKHAAEIAVIEESHKRELERIRLKVEIENAKNAGKAINSPTEPAVRKMPR